jgi:hypothetical protein
VPFEKKIRDARDHARFIAPDYGDGGELFHVVFKVWRQALCERPRRPRAANPRVR